MLTVLLSPRTLEAKVHARWRVEGASQLGKSDKRQEGLCMGGVWGWVSVGWVNKWRVWLTQGLSQVTVRVPGPMDGRNIGGSGLKDRPGDGSEEYSALCQGHPWHSLGLLQKNM
jgi:hypothetical protein